MGRAADQEAEPAGTTAHGPFSRRVETLSAALTAIRNLSRQGDAEAERQFTALAADMERYLAHLKSRLGP